MNHTHNTNQVCEPVEVVNKRGIHKFVYLCKKPFTDRIATYKQSHIHFWTDLALVATIAILATTLISLLIFNAFKQRNQLELIAKPIELTLGKPALFEVSYKNTSKKESMSVTHVTVRAPQTLKNVTLNHPNLEKVSLSLPLETLDPLESGHFFVAGDIFTDINTDIKLLFITDYVNDVGQAQQESTAQNFTVKNSLVSIKSSSPEKVLVGSEFETTISIQTDLETLEEYELAFSHPQEYILVSKSAELKDLGKNNKELKLVGYINGQPTKAPLVINLKRKIGDTSFVFAQSAQTIASEFSKIKIDFTHKENNNAVKPGEESIVTILVENNSDSDVTDPALIADVSGEFADLTFLEKEYSAQRNKVTFTLPTIAKHSTYQQTFAVKALSHIIPKNTELGPQNITIAAKISGKINNSAISSSTPASLEIPINSNLTLKSQGIFYTNTGDQIGIGSVPPKVDEYTAYWAVVSVTNGVNKLRNVTLRASIPPTAEYTDIYNITDGAPIRSISANQIEWYLGELEPYAGIINKAPEMRLQIGVLPDAKDLGKILPLLNNISISGIDERTGETLNATTSNITTAIFNDPVMNKVR